MTIWEEIATQQKNVYEIGLSRLWGTFSDAVLVMTEDRGQKTQAH
jgi:hypothetical protein